jgi:chorismate synthase
VLGWVRQIGDLEANIEDPAAVTLEQVEANPVRCPDARMAARMQALVEEVRSERDSIGGVAEIVAIGVPAGWGEPVFDKLKADLAKALFSLPAVLGVEYGAGFGVARLRGSQNNDPLASREGKVVSLSNRHGGMLGGISSGMPIVLRCAVKPTSSIPQPQETVDRSGTATTVAVRGRHDPCLLPRFVPMGEAMVAIVLADHCLRQRAQRVLEGEGRGAEVTDVSGGEGGGSER